METHQENLLQQPETPFNRCQTQEIYKREFKYEEGNR